VTGRSELLVSPGVPSAKWELFPRITGHMLMLGWRLPTGRSVDDGVPSEVALVLARALTSLGWVSFFEGSEPSRSPDDHVSRIRSTGLGERIRAVAAGLPKQTYLVSTRRPELAASAFEASFFSWVMQGQAILISPHDCKPPVLEWGQMLSITGGEKSAFEAALSAWGAEAVLRPGVDGAVVGLLAANEGVKERALASIKDAASNNGFDVRTLAEDEFAEALADRTA
jgi:hypothetical protein